MATDKNTLKNWFKTGLKPLQAHFWAWLDSYWHKDEKIPMNNIDGIDKVLENKAEISALNAKANADSSGLTAENIISWKQALGVGEVPDNMATIDKDGVLGNVYGKTQVDDLLESSGKNIGNSDLETTDNRTFTQKHIYTHATGGFPYRITGLADKSVDTAFNGILVSNANGDVAVTTNSALLVNGMKAMDDAQKDAYRVAIRKEGEDYSLGSPIVYSISPPIQKKELGRVKSFVLRGNSLYLNPNTTRITAIPVGTAENASTHAGEIPCKSFFSPTSGDLLRVDFDSDRLLQDVEYNVLIWVDNPNMYKHRTAMSIRLVADIEYIDLSQISWDKITASDYNRGNAPQTYGMGGMINIVNEDLSKKSALIRTALKSSKIFNANDNFLITLSFNINQYTGNAYDNIMTALQIVQNTSVNALASNGLIKTIYGVVQGYTNYVSAPVSAFIDNISSTTNVVRSGNAPHSFSVTFIKEGNNIYAIGSGTNNVSYVKSIPINDDFAISVQVPYRNTQENTTISIVEAFKF